MFFAEFSQMVSGQIVASQNVQILTAQGDSIISSDSIVMFRSDFVRLPAIKTMEENIKLFLSTLVACLKPEFDLGVFSVYLLYGGTISTVECVNQ